MILAEGLQKDFKVYQKRPGLKGSLASFFSRQYETKQAIAPLDFSIEQGEIVGLLGPNGAGKTTLMKMMTGIIVPTAGQLTVMGFCPHKRDLDFRRQIALVMGQKSQLWWDLPAMDSFQLIQKYYELEKPVFKQRVEELAHLLNVENLLQIHVRKLSLGERMKLELMASLLHDPKVMFLDEPTIGLDVVAQKTIRDFLIKYHAEKKPTLILTSHYMADIEALCKRMILVIEGNKRFDGTIETFASLLGSNKMVTFRFEGPVSAQEQAHFAAFQPIWHADATSVELSIPVEHLRAESSEILSRYAVEDFSTGKLPIERVLETLLTDPKFKAKNETLG